jgi:hypothetical protein
LVRDETHRNQKIETKIKVEKKQEKGRAIKNQIEKMGESNKNETQKR